MDLARDVCSSTLSVRKAHKRRVRLPLNSVTVASPDADRLAGFTDLIADEVNVRSVELTTDVASVAIRANCDSFRPSSGPVSARTCSTVIKAHKAGDWSVAVRRRLVVTVGGVVLEPGEYSIEQVASDDQASTGLGSHDGVVALDIDGHRGTGSAKVWRATSCDAIQQARRDADLARVGPGRCGRVRRRRVSRR